MLLWFPKAARDLPWRRTLDPYAVWVSEIMLQQTQVKTVIPYWERWMRELPDVQALSETPEERLLKLWEGLGYYRRVRNMQKAALHIRGNCECAFPRSHAGLMELPGVGRYTAGAIASIAFNEPEPILDGNVIRVLSRVFAIEASTKEKSTLDQLWELAKALVEAAVTLNCPDIAPMRLSGPCSALNQSLMELGATVCVPVEPECGRCPLAQKCQANQKGLVAQLPNAGARQVTVRRSCIAFVVEEKGRFLVRRREGSLVNGGLWEFPNGEFSGNESQEAQTLAGACGLIAVEGPVHSVKHSITRHRIEMKVYLASARGKATSRGNNRWVDLKQLDALPFSSAHRQVLEWIKSRREAAQSK